MASSDNAVEVVHDLMIPMRDGVRLAANLYRPVGNGRWPCLVNYLPYHKDGRGGLWYQEIHRYFAQRGYGSLVVDFRGLGCSEGINSFPFDAQEGRDGHDAVEWTAAQSWCDGNVGMWGSSYGGITALKTAAERPPHLKAIVPVHVTTDNYLDFLLLGGCRNGFWPSGDWGPRMVAYNLTPPLAPDPDGRLARLWAERLQHSRPWCLDWYDSSNEAARWAERAIPVERITAATYAVCGWKDFYVEGTLDYFKRISAPKKLLMGPWKHAFPNLSAIEPINLLELMVRWWDRWLRGEPNKIDAGPPVTIFVQGTGAWRQEETWPPQRNEARELYLLPNHDLGASPPVGPAESGRYRYDPTVGLDSMAFDPWTGAVTDPGEHNGDDARSFCFTTAPLSDDWEVAGAARVLLTVRSSVTGLNFVAKLCDVEESGRSRLVTMGWSPDSAAEPEIEHSVEIALRSTSYVFRRGHRLRLSLALADFPRLWPTPSAGEIRLEFGLGKCARLLVPFTPPQRSALPAPEIPPLDVSVRSSTELDATQSWQVGRELVSQSAVMESRGVCRYRMRDGGVITYSHEYNASVSQANPAGAAINVRSDIEVKRDTGEVAVKTMSVFTPEAATIHAEILQAGTVIWHKDWKQRRAP